MATSSCRPARAGQPSVDAGKQAPIYRADSVFQMVGDGPLTPVQQAALTPAERRNWQP